MFNWNDLKKIKGFKTNIVKTEDITDKDFVKKLRLELNLSQILFAKILGISNKTIEKWEQGSNPIKGTSSKLLYLLSMHKELINELYIVDGVMSENDLPKYNKYNYEVTYNMCNFVNNNFSENNNKRFIA